MTMQTVLTTALQRVATEFNTIKLERGNLASLTTTDKTSLVNALNEVIVDLNNSTSIDDASASATSTYSSNKITADINAAISNLVDSAPAALDTLNELATAISGNDTDINTILTAQANRVRTDTATQGLNATEQSNARTNIDAQSATDIGDTAHDFTADFTAALT